MLTKEIQQELVLLRSGLLGNKLNLPQLVEEGLINKKAAEIYLEELGSNVPLVADNDNCGRLSKAMKQYYAGV